METFVLYALGSYCINTHVGSFQVVVCRNKVNCSYLLHAYNFCRRFALEYHCTELTNMDAFNTKTFGKIVLNGQIQLKFFVGLD